MALSVPLALLCCFKDVCSRKGLTTMSSANASSIHPSALVSPEVKLAENVRVGPFAVIEGPVVVGEGSIIRPHVHLIGPLTIGTNNDIGTGAVLGGSPQHLGYKGDSTAIE